jgi:putative ABC transport system permease protein
MTILQDLRHSARTMRQAPAFSMVVTLTIALGVGATTAIFSVVDAVLLRPLPYPTQRALVKLFDVANNREAGALSFPEFVDWRDRAGDVFDAVGAFARRGEVLSGAGDAEQLQGTQVTVEIPGLLGVRPIAGRSLTAADELPGGPHVVILGDALWRSHFAADPAIIGRTVTLTGVSYQVIGVFPSTASTVLPSPYHMARGKAPDFWEPLQGGPQTSPRGLHQLDAIARLRPGVTLTQAAGRVESLAATIQKDPSTTHGVRLHPLAAVLVGDFEAPLALLLSAVALLLLIACGNVANLLLARSAARQREFAVRSALGAGRRHLVMLVLVDSVARAAIGGAGGVVLAYVIVQLARSALVGAIPRVGTAAIDGRVLAVACAVSLLSGVLFGVTPALRAGTRDVVMGLGGARGAVTNVSRDVVRRFLMAGEIALSFVLLATAALLGQSYLNLMAVPTGFDPEGLITARVWLPSTRYPDGRAQNAFFDRLTDRLSDIGLQAVTLASDLPIEGGTYGGVALDNPKFPDGALHVEKRIVAANYFKVLKAQLIRGRFFEPSDREGSQPVVIVNETFERQWLEGDGIGERVAFAWGINGLQTVVGVVGDVREGALHEQPKAAIYVSRAQRPYSDMHIIVRTSRRANDVVKTLRTSVASIDVALPLIDITSAPELVANSVRPQKLTSDVIGAFAVSALLLAAIGLYGVISYSVAQRTQELGIRAALGAQARDLLRLVLRQSLGVTLVGVVLGALGALAGSRLLSAELFGVSATDPRVFAGVAFLLFVVAVVSSALPALRATRVSPLDALRTAQ